MRLKAYVLAADPTWIETSVLSYYDLVDEIIVSYDENGNGWTGVPIPVTECLQQLQKIDRDGKLKLCPGHYARRDHNPMENDTYQRQCALDQAGKDADWVIQIDTDEVLPRPEALLRLLSYAEARQIDAVEWPMRVFFRQMAQDWFLEVCGSKGLDTYEYPGPVAVRPGVTLREARRSFGAFLRPFIKGDTQSLQITRAAEPDEVRIGMDDPAAAILHFSWARPAAQIRSKIASWSHNDGWRSWLFYYRVWAPAPYLWRWTRDFHPFSRGLWPALKTVRIDLGAGIEAREGQVRQQSSAATYIETSPRSL